MQVSGSPRIWGIPLFLLWKPPHQADCLDDGSWDPPMDLGDPPHQLILAEIQRCIILETPSSPLGDPPGILWGIPRESPSRCASHPVIIIGGPPGIPLGDPPALLPLGDPPGIPLGDPPDGKSSDASGLEAPASGGSPDDCSWNPPPKFWKPPHQVGSPHIWGIPLFHFWKPPHHA